MAVLDRPAADPAFDEPLAVPPRSQVWPWTLLAATAIGIVSGSITIVDKIALLNDPTRGSLCDVSAQVGCTPVLLAPQSSVLGPPNALLGVIMFGVLATSGLVVVTGGRLSAGYRQALVGLSVFFALFLTWYMQQVAFEIGSLCPFCTLCAAAVLTATLATVRMAADRDGNHFARGLASLTRGDTDVVMVVGWGVLIGAMLYAGIWL